MNVVVPIRDFASDAAPQSSGKLSLGSQREIWADRRRFMERQRRHISPDKSRPHWESAVFGYGVRAFAWAARFFGIHRRGRHNALAPDLVELTFSFPDLPPAFDGYRILHVSDTHLDCLPDLADVAGRMVSGLEVDLVALTGDVHGHHRALLTHSVEPLARMLAGVAVRDHRLAVLGNHDPVDMAEALERIGYTMLINGSTVLERKGQRLVVTGLDDVHRFYTAAATRALVEAPQGFRIALVHSAEVADHAESAGFALYLCGHTHGGQICLPNGRAVLSRLRRCHFGAAGEWRFGRLIGYTSRGLGISGAALRYNCPGEMSVITLRRQASEGKAVWS
jgi:predicted MPP superfamily phosphohydrolase